MCEVCSKAPLTHCNAISRSPLASLSFDIAFLFVHFFFFFLTHLNLTLVSFFSFYHSDITGVIISCFLPHSFIIALFLTAPSSSFTIFHALSRGPNDKYVRINLFQIHFRSVLASSRCKFLPIPTCSQRSILFVATTQVHLTLFLSCSIPWSLTVRFTILTVLDLDNVSYVWFYL